MAKKIYKVTQSQLKTLQEGGSFNVDGITYTYETGADTVYVVVDPAAPEYRLTWSSSDNHLSLTKDSTIVSSFIIPYATRAGYSTYSHTLVYPNTGNPTYTLNLNDGGTIGGTVYFGQSIKVANLIKLGLPNDEGYAILGRTSSGSILYLDDSDERLYLGKYLYIPYTVNSSTGVYTTNAPVFDCPENMKFSESNYAFANLQEALDAKVSTTQLGDQVTFTYAGGVLTITSKG